MGSVDRIELFPILSIKPLGFEIGRNYEFDMDLKK